MYLTNYMKKKNIFQNLSFYKKIFEHGLIYPGDKALNCSFIKCSFINCWTYGDKENFSLAENILFENTKLKTKVIYDFILRNITINTCKNTALFRVENCLFDRVKMSGQFGKWMIQSSFNSEPKKKTKASKFYEKVEWALDISEAYFKALTLRNLPAQKIIRDPNRHFLVCKERFLTDPSWEKIINDIGWAAVARDTITNPYYDDVFWCISDFNKEREETSILLNKLKKEGFLN